MIARVNEHTSTPDGPLSEALGRPLSAQEGLTEYTVVAHWPGLDLYTLDDEQAIWTTVQWAEHLEDPLLEHPFATSSQIDRRAIFHLDIRLHPDDRELSGPEWAEAAHRLARAAGIEVPGDENGCRWIAVQGQPGRLDLIANLIRVDGTWQQQPRLLPRLMDASRHIEQDLRLASVPVAHDHQSDALALPTASAQLATVLNQIADERYGALAAVRGLVEHTAHRLARHPGGTDPDIPHRLELIAHRLYGIQQALDTTAGRLTAPRRPRPPVPLPRPVKAAPHRTP